MEHIDGAVINPKDGKLIETCKEVLAPIVTNVVDAVYDHLLKYDLTAESFAPKQSQEGVTADANVRDLHAGHENIKYRKDFLKGYLVRLVSNHGWTPESKFWEYIDMVGNVHTGSTDSGLKHRKNRSALFVEYREVNLLLGWVENAVTDIVMGVEGLELQTKVDILKALNKFWWIQNDLFARHYITGLKVPQVEEARRLLTWIDKLKADPVFPIVSAIVLFVAIFSLKF
ncbi:uncharacterized protein Z519_12750 [Cladophialophora bantiana CBS 173.52]|uniref:Globin-sensor domain-containing protein n=1 Tax=Cladophialophora bantiana (strain ATCC 10958 / CBS 173.52 / CDC B-1940 / NIH 8579) TaxID=1442370 RepID=A0A0D2H6X4_CLAB1|nr:uncharacterized protein Z519_12750 [Cladophialophora bantiana CBS 173.52]KIW86625.1 hypothetical protein Z519_12750 [Cladophialophora bantiana CBS 173.52]